MAVAVAVMARVGWFWLLLGCCVVALRARAGWGAAGEGDKWVMVSHCRRQLSVCYDSN